MKEWRAFTLEVFSGIFVHYGRLHGTVGRCTGTAPGTAVLPYSDRHLLRSYKEKNGATNLVSAPRS